MPVVSLLPASPGSAQRRVRSRWDGRDLPRPTVGCDLGAVEMTPNYVADRVIVDNSRIDDVELNVGDGVCAAADGAARCGQRPRSRPWAAPSRSRTPRHSATTAGVARLGGGVAASLGRLSDVGRQRFGGDLAIENEHFHDRRQQSGGEVVATPLGCITPATGGQGRGRRTISTNRPMATAAATTASATSSSSRGSRSSARPGDHRPGRRHLKRRYRRRGRGEVRLNNVSARRTNLEGTVI